MNFLTLARQSLAVVATVYCLQTAAAEVPFGMELATTPVSGLEETGWREFWKPRYLEKYQQAEKEGNQIKIVFLGDSITNFWDNTKLFQQYFGKYNPLNLGFSGDRTQQMLWIIEKSDIWEKISPEMIVVMIGTNNLGWKESGVEATTAAIQRSLESLRKLEPEAKIILCSIFPRGAAANDVFRADIQAINRNIKKFADDEHIFYLHIYDKLLNEDGTLSPEIMPDYLHPNDNGYEIWGNALMPYVKKFLEAPEKDVNP